MIRLQEPPILDVVNKKATVALFADTKAEVTDDLDVSTIQGFPSGYTMEFGSSAFTADMDIGYLKSNGKWSWG